MLFVRLYFVYQIPSSEALCRPLVARLCSFRGFPLPPWRQFFAWLVAHLWSFPCLGMRPFGVPIHWYKRKKCPFTARQSVK